MFINENILNYHGKNRQDYLTRLIFPKNAVASKPAILVEGKTSHHGNLSNDKSLEIPGCPLESTVGA